METEEGAAAGYGVNYPDVSDLERKAYIWDPWFSAYK